MAWVIGLLALVGFCYLMYANERFRRFGFGLLALVLAGFAALWFMSDSSSRRYKAERERELTAVTEAQLGITDLQLVDTGYGWRVTGNVQNRSPHPLRALTIRISLMECPLPSSPDGCVITGEDDARFYVEVPAGQARRLETSVQFENAATLGTGWSWDYSVTQIEADLR